MAHTKSTREGGGTARLPAVTATLAALLLLAVSIVGQVAAGADYPAVPPGVVIPLGAAVLLLWRTNRWTIGLPLAVGLLIGVGALVTPNTGDHLASGDTALVVSTVAELVALAGLVVAAAAAALLWKGARD
ncbi:hypothetical protein AB0I77_43675 [Streptomyces sp. NPDC050619]|uniref:hypothetical protein n=1 Tax=Streptomyces sp. NPDC050619 TaxID=3157214 RepID=UPI00342D19B9